MIKERDNFFGKKNLIRAGWIILIGILGFMARSAYDWVKGPQQVIVKNITDVNQQTLRVQFDYPKNTISPKTEESINNLTTELRKLLKEITSQSMNTSPPFNAPAIIPLTNPIQEPPFELPISVGGYTVRSFKGMTDAICPEKEIHVNAKIDFSFKVRDSTSLESITPLFVYIDRINSPNSLTRTYYEQYQIKEGKNSIAIELNLKTGEYELQYGYYRKNELDEKYPNFYNKICTLSVAD